MGVHVIWSNTWARQYPVIRLEIYSSTNALVIKIRTGSFDPELIKHGMRRTHRSTEQQIRQGIWRRQGDKNTAGAVRWNILRSPSRAVLPLRRVTHKHQAAAESQQKAAGTRWLSQEAPAISVLPSHQNEHIFSKRRRYLWWHSIPLKHSIVG